MLVGIINFEQGSNGWGWGILHNVVRNPFPNSDFGHLLLGGGRTLRLAGKMNLCTDDKYLNFNII